MASIKYRLALDLGANSLGWCVYRLDDSDEPVAVVRMGSRIFSDGRASKNENYASLAANRRAKRQARRRRDRVLKRRHRLMQALVQFGLMPADAASRKQLQELDPYTLRARGLDQPLTPHELGRALYHLARKRGFRSSRKDARDEKSKDVRDKKSQEESGKVDAAIAALRGRIKAADCRTVGEYLARQHAERTPVRARRSSDGQYVLYLQRAMVAEEFDALWAAQQPYHPHLLTDSTRDILRDIMLFQRRLRPVEPGRCQFEPEEYRARLCAPLQQRFRILQDLNHLRVRDGINDRALTLDERNRMLQLLQVEPGLATFSKLAKAAGLRNASAFNYGRDEKRKGFKGDAVGARFAAPDALGESWHKLTAEQQYALAVLVEQADQMEPLIAALQALPADTARAADIMNKQHDEALVSGALRSLPISIDEKQARVLAAFDLPDDYGSLSLKALARIVPELEREVINYDEAVRRAGYQHHSQFYTGEIFPRLPYYGQLLVGYTSPTPTAADKDERRYGKIPNPTVHIGLNQVRQLVNALIKRYGHPHQIVVELTREFGASGERRREISKQQAEAQTRNERHDAELTALSRSMNVDIRCNRENRMKLRLWEELGKDHAMDPYCIYSGKRLGCTLLFSDEIEIDHILPFSRSLHDGIGNKLLCVRQSNRDKGNRTPFEAWGHTDRWAGVIERAERLPEHKRKLFRENAVETFLDGKDFLDRHLTDTAYLGRAAKQYLSGICPPNFIWVSSGRLTGLVRGKFGLSKLLSDDGIKNREDHRHHALDAAVIGLCSRSLIQRMATAAANAEMHGENRLLERLELPWPSYREELAACLAAIVVSHKPDRGVQGAMHRAGSYWLKPDAPGSGEQLYCAHVPIESIDYGNVAPDGGKRGRPSPKVRSQTLRERLAALLAGKSDRECKQALLQFSLQTGIRRVQLQQRFGTAIPITRRNREPYRYVVPDENYCRDIVRGENGRWESKLVDSFKANQPEFDPRRMELDDGSRVLMRIRKGDMLIIEEAGATRVMRVASFTNEGVALAEHKEGNTAERDSKHIDGFSYRRLSPEPLRKLRARIVGVDILGYVNDPGFHD